MKQSESIKNIAKALITFQLKVGKINKDSQNPFFKSKYASLSNIIEHIQIPLGESGLSIAQFPDDTGITSILMHESGEYIQATYTMPVARINDPQAVGSAITYARRYALGSILGLNIDEDDDANKASEHSKVISTTYDKPDNYSANNDDKKWLNRYIDKAHTKETKDWTNAVSKLTNGEITINDIEKHYKINKETKQQLLDLSIF